MYSRDGKELIAAIYEDLHYITNDFIIVSQNKKYGIVNISNQSVIPVVYDKVYLDWYKVYYQNQEPEIFVLKNGVYSQFDKNNKLLKTNISED